MIEIIRHTLGLCGEPHPSLLYILFGSFPVWKFLKYWWKYKFGKND